MRSRLLFPLLAALACAGVSAQDAERSLTWAQYRDRLRGGWVGQMVGVAYGWPYEFKAQGETIEGPLASWTPERLPEALAQDDLYVEVRFLQVLAEHGPDLRVEQAAAAIRDAEFPLWHASDAARENLRQGIAPELAGHPRYNPHADCIDFQIESDLFGLLAPGMPGEAGRLADRFSPLLGWGDGRYGGLFVAGMVAHAWLEDGAGYAARRRCVEAGLAMIPRDSDCAAVIRDVLAARARWPADWRKAWRRLEERWAAGDLCPRGAGQPFNIDAKLNGGYVVLGLLYGEGDFAKTLEITTRCGQDADCNPATAGSVLGVLLGFDGLPAELTAGIDGLAGRRFQHTEHDLPGALAACEALTRALVRSRGGIVDASGLRLPPSPPRAPASTDRMRAFPAGDLEAWRLDATRRRLRRLASEVSLADWAAGWEAVAIGTAMEPGLRTTALERADVLVLHPVDAATPAAIERRLRLPGGAHLRFAVASHPEPAHADFELRVLADSRLVLERVVATLGAWEEVDVDLSSLAGRDVLLRIENRAGGRRPWFNEAAYLSRLRIVTD